MSLEREVYVRRELTPFLAHLPKKVSVASASLQYNLDYSSPLTSSKRTARRIKLEVWAEFIFQNISFLTNLMSEELLGSVDQIRLLHSTASPTDSEKWPERLKEELLSLISVLSYCIHLILVCKDE